jgi:alginate O-acetyltransferase complex protein AlgI
LQIEVESLVRFDSIEFLFFCVAVFTLERFIVAGKARKLLLLIASYVFYASWNPAFVLLLLFSTVLDFQVGKWLHRAKNHRGKILGLSLLGNLGVLLFFKYGALFQDVAGLVPELGLQTAFPRRADLIIPLGISFYTFQTMSYSIDIYRRKIQPCTSLLDFSLFVTFFPQLVAGPVMRASQLLPQIQANRTATRAQVRSGVELFGVGLIKKVVIADNLAMVVDACFAHPGSYTSGSLMVAMFAFLGQIYCDFSGYSTMARGLGKMLGFELPRNFNYPLLAKNPIESMTGWHITMNQWFRDYVYLPIAIGRRWLKVRRIGGMLVAWALFGLWHGATWNFLIWGLFNGLRIVTYRLTRRRLRSLREQPGYELAGRVLTLLVFCFVCVLFRATDLQIAGVFFEKLLQWSTDGAVISSAWLKFIALLLALHIASKRWYKEDLMERLSPSGQVALVGCMGILVSVFAGADKPFIYFQF